MGRGPRERIDRRTRLTRHHRWPGAILLFATFLATGTLTLAGELRSDQARVLIVIKNFQGTPIPAAQVRLVGVGFDETHEGITDNNGEFVVVLPQGKTYDVTCHVGPTRFRFGPKQIPVAGAPLNYTLRLSVQATVVSSPDGGRVAAPIPDAHVILSVVNSLNQPEPDAVVTLLEQSSGKRYELRTDSNGQYELDLPKGSTYHVLCDKYGVTFDLGTQTIPQVDTFRLTLKVILDRAAFEKATATQASRTAIVVVSLVDQHGNPESGAIITMTAVETGDQHQGVSDSAGRFVFNLPRATTYHLLVQKNGIDFDAGEHAVGDVDQMEIPVQVSLATRYVETYRLENVYFDFDKATLKPESYAALDELVAVMKKHPTMVIELAGHTDARGDEAYNLRLSRARANAVRDYLAAHGVPLERVTAKGYGELEPVASNDTDEGRRLNRRTEVRVISR